MKWSVIDIKGRHCIYSLYYRKSQGPGAPAPLSCGWSDFVYNYKDTDYDYIFYVTFTGGSFFIHYLCSLFYNVIMIVIK